MPKIPSFLNCSYLLATTFWLQRLHHLWYGRRNVWPQNKGGLEFPSYFFSELFCIWRHNFSFMTSFLLNYQGSQRSGKTWKTWKTLKRGCFSGKTWKSQGTFVKFLKSQGKVREFFSRMPWIWWFLANLRISILQIFSSRTQPWWVLQIIIITTKINTLDYCKSDKDVFEERDYFI